MKTDHSAQIVIAQTAGDIYSTWVEGSFDGTNWFLLGGLHDQNTGAPSTTTVVASGVYLTKPVRYVRTAGDAGAGSPVVSTLLTSR